MRQEREGTKPDKPENLSRPAGVAVPPPPPATAAPGAKEEGRRAVRWTLLTKTETGFECEKCGGQFSFAVAPEFCPLCGAQNALEKAAPDTMTVTSTSQVALAHSAFLTAAPGLTAPAVAPGERCPACGSFVAKCFNCGSQLIAWKIDLCNDCYRELEEAK